VIISTIRSEEVSSLGRLDAWYHLAPGAGAARRIDKAKAAGLETVPLHVLGNAWMPTRLTQVVAASDEESLPYIKPYDIFQYLPVAYTRLSKRNIKRISDYTIKEGWLLQTRSGRNLGLNALVDEDTAAFIVSDDLIRIDIPDERLRFYVTAFLRTRTGHGLLRRDKSGSVIDHLDPKQVRAIEIPMLSDDVLTTVSDLMRKSFLQRQSSRRILRHALADYEAQLPQIKRERPHFMGWSVRSSSIGTRLDAASHDPFVDEVRAKLLSIGGVPLASVANPIKPPGRIKTRYVGPDAGEPWMSGTQILQYEFAKPQFMHLSALPNTDAYRVRAGWSVYMADGRSELNLGMPSMVTCTRDGWLASGHVGRLVPKEGTNPGWLWLAARTWYFGVQLKALSSGSVVDATFPTDAASVILPPTLDVDGDAITAAWEEFSQAQLLEAEAIRLLDASLAKISGVTDDELEADLTAEAIDSPAVDSDETAEDAGAASEVIVDRADRTVEVEQEPAGAGDDGA
jgi:hypothetical protein